MDQQKKRDIALILIVALIISLPLYVTGLSSESQVVKAQTDAWAIIGSEEQVPQIENIFWLFGNQSIPYTTLSPDAVVNYDGIAHYAGLVLWTNLGSYYNSSAIRQFAETSPVISHIQDFCISIYPTLSEAIVTVRTATVEYVADWGNFRKGDEVEMHNGTYYLTGVTSQSLVDFADINTLSRFGTTTTMFYVAGQTERSGFLVLDLHATTSNSYQAGNWHLFPAIAKVSTVRAGQYARWMTDGLSWHSLEWIYAWMADFSGANEDIVKMQTIGTSVQGRPINAFFIGKGSRYFLADSTIHGVEKAGSHALLRFAELLVEWYRTEMSWQDKLAEYKVILIPVLNPDGYVADTRNNANNKDLNRQFPPGATTTEPEALALRQLMATYPPTQYVSLHTGGDISPLHVYYTDPGSAYRNYALWAVNEGNQMFKNMKHWGTVFDNVWVGAYRYIGVVSQYGSLSASYAAYVHKAIAFTVEHWSAPKVNLHSQEFFISTLLAPLLYHDRSETAMIYSNAFITKTTVHGQADLSLYLDGTLVSGTMSETRVYDFISRGKPVLVYVDGIQVHEGSAWTWGTVANTISVSGATESITFEWVGGCSCDVNQDGWIDMLDLILVTSAFKSRPSGPNWNPSADVNKDAVVDISDAILVAGRYGDKCG